MKKLVFLFWVSVLLCPLTAQVGQNRIKKGLPAFNILQIDGTHFKASDLNKDLPVMLVYFDPDCDHCRLFIQELLKQADSFRQVQIVMVTYVPIQQVKKFVANTGLSNYPAIKVGTESSDFVVRYHYNIMQFPFLALHDENGQLFATYESVVPAVDKLAMMFRGKNK